MNVHFSCGLLAPKSRFRSLTDFGCQRVIALKTQRVDETFVYASPGARCAPNGTYLGARCARPSAPLYWKRFVQSEPP
jgi:hypothetical protein